MCRTQEKRKRNSKRNIQTKRKRKREKKRKLETRRSNIKRE